MKNWIEVHGYTYGNAILVNLANVTCIAEDLSRNGSTWIYLVKENDDGDTESVHCRESYSEVKDLIAVKGG